MVYQSVQLLSESAVEEICRHEELESDLRRDGELGDLSGAVGVSSFIGEVHADFLKYVTWNLSEIDLVSFIFSKLAGAGQHGLDGARGEGVIPRDNELVTIAADQLHIHCVRALTATVHLLPSIHSRVSGRHFTKFFSLSLVEVN
jgi:hypothetical protein